MEPNQINILIIGDKKEDSDKLQDLLSGLAYNVNCAKSPQEAFGLAQETSFAVVITELRIKTFSAIEIASKMLLINKNTSIIVITDSAFIPSAIDVMEKGAYGYITKPYNSKEVKVIVEHAVERFVFLSSRRENQHMAGLSIRDGLTGVYNRRFLQIYLENKMSLVKRKFDKFSLLMVDIDHFKKYNDDYGHQAGDVLLIDICKLFHDSIRSDDSVFRYGGEEFIIFLNRTGKKDAALVAERIRNSASLTKPVTVSIGVGGFPEDGEKIEEMIKKIDEALYRAKEAGRNRVYLAE